ncbi:MAG: flagellar motor protein MotB [bacterium]
MRKKKEDSLVNPHVWMYSFSDLLTNMLTFFVLLFSMSSMNNLQLKTYLGSLRGALGTLGKGRFTSIGKPKLLIHPHITAEGYSLLEDAVIRALLSKSESVDVPISESIHSFEIYSTTKFAQILFPAKIAFQEDKMVITPQIAQQLHEITDMLKKFPYPIRINGYSSSGPSKAGEQKGRYLSRKRAAAILDFFITSGGLSPERFSMAGYGNLRKEGRETKDEDYVEVFIIKPTNWSI